jgi:hypothetical protein
VTPLPGREGKGGALDALAAEKAAELGRLVAEAARVLGCGDAGLEAAGAVIRAGLLRLGGSMLGEVLAAGRGHRGPRVPCGQGHEAVFAGYRDKSFGTVLGQPGHRGARLVSLRGLCRPAAEHAASRGQIPRTNCGQAAERSDRRLAIGPLTCTSW